MICSVLYRTWVALVIQMQDDLSNCNVYSLDPCLMFPVIETPTLPKQKVQ